MSEESLKDRELNLRREDRHKGGRTRKPTTAVKQKAYEMEADRTKGHQDKKRRMTNLGGPKTQQRHQSRSPHDKTGKTEKHQHCQQEPDPPENQGCIRLPHSYTDGNAMGHHLFAREVLRKTDKRDCDANYVLSNAPKMMGGVASSG